MATALVQGALKAGVCTKEQIYASDRLQEAVKALSAKCGVHAATNNDEAAALSNAILLCVKPGDALEALGDIRDDVRQKLIISIVAGVKLQTLQEAVGKEARVIRVMPNTPALIHRGAAAYCSGDGVTAEDTALVEKIFAAVGKVFRVKEEMLDVVTGLSGSGPAYICVAIEALADAGVLMGLPRDLALQLAAHTTAGAAEMVLQTGAHPAQLKDMVASPGGTTIAGLEALEASGLRSALINAVRAATERSVELGA
jgi:pyrroline-5-carboxylate reductase